MNKTVEVVAAVIRNGCRIFCTQRGYGEFKDFWEFPGGKIEPGETAEQALRREIREELDTDVEVGPLLSTIQYDYPHFHLILHCFVCRVVRGALVLKEHEAAKWVDKDEVGKLRWLPADLQLIPTLCKLLEEIPEDSGEATLS